MSATATTEQTYGIKNIVRNSFLHTMSWFKRTDTMSATINEIGILSAKYNVLTTDFQNILSFNAYAKLSNPTHCKSSSANFTSVKAMMTATIMGINPKIMNPKTGMPAKHVP